MSGEKQSASNLPPAGKFSELSLEKLDAVPKCAGGVTNVLSKGELGVKMYLCRRQLQHKFVSERNWEQYHTPRNLMLALVGEVGELAEIFQWKGEVSPGVPELAPAEKSHLAEEISDVLLYLVRLAERCEIDMSAEVLRKMEKNAEKYPVEKIYGRSEKYTDYNTIEKRAEGAN